MKKQVNFIQPVKLSKYPSRTKKDMRLIDKKPYGDKDKDKVMNINDCKPHNKKKQGLLGGLLALAITAEVAGHVIRGMNKNLPKDKNKKRGFFY